MVLTKIRYCALGIYLGQALAIGFFQLYGLGFLKGFAFGLMWPILAPLVAVLVWANLL